MACGDRYAHLIVTASGLSPANPYDRVPTSSDYEEWHELARSLSVTAHAFLEALGEAEPSPYTEYNALIERNNAMTEAYEALPSSWVAIRLAAQIGEAQSVCRQATCLMELAEDAMAKYGIDAPEVPSAPPPTEKPKDVVDLAAGSLTTVAVVVVGGFILYKIVTR